MDEEPRGRRPGRLEEVDRGDVAAEESGVEDEGVSQGKAQKKAQEQREAERRPEAGQFGRQNAHEPMGKPQNDEAGEEEDDDQDVDARQPAQRRSGAPARPDEAPQAAPEQPGAEEESERQLVAGEHGREFPEEIDLERRGQEAQEEGRQPRSQVQRPGMIVPHFSHLPLSIRTASIR